MNQAVVDRPASVHGGDLVADLTYTLDTGEKLVNETFGPNNIHRKNTGTPDLRAMQVRNGRPLAAQFKLDVNGFEFVELEHRTDIASLLEVCGVDLQTAYDLYHRHHCNLQVPTSSCRPQSAKCWASSRPSGRNA